MSEMGEMRRDDLERDTSMGDVRQGDGLGDGLGDVRQGDGLGDTRRDAAMGEVQQGDAMRQVGGETTTDDVRRPGHGGADAEPALSTDQIANPGAQQSAGSPSAGADTADRAGTGDTRESGATQLLDPADREAMTQRWRDIQADFVDQPQKAMKDADALVAGLMQQLAQMFSQERSQLEAQWSRGDQVSTEDLRVSLQRYRAFFERLLSV
jgi:hypothetical protein